MNPIFPSGPYSSATGPLVLFLAMLSFPMACTGERSLGSVDASVGDAPARFRHGEECGNGMDDDDDGLIDEGCPCSPTETQGCFGGRYPNRLIGRCRDGSQLCEAAVRGDEFGSWGGCEGDITPAGERCDGLLDDNCDGAIDEGCACEGAMSRICGAEFSTGTCRPGEQVCGDDGLWSGCIGAIGPGPELCDDGLDNDCDGIENEGCQCFAAPEGCGDGVDNDCDGLIDEPRCIGDSVCPLRESHTIAITASPDHACALIDDGRVYCWGDNSAGTLGIGEGAGPERVMEEVELPGNLMVTLDRDYSPVPIQVPGIHSATSIDSSSVGGTCVLSRGRPVCFGPDSGARYNQETGRFDKIRWLATVEQEALPLGWLRQVAVANHVVFVRDAEGQVWGWGERSWGILGNLDHIFWSEGDPAVPVRVQGSVDVDSVGNTACAVQEGGAVYCWGFNRSGAAGEIDGIDTSQDTPRQILGIDDAMSVESGTYHTCALRSSGEVACWGPDGYRGDGTLRSGLNDFSASATAVVGLSDIVRLEASYGATCALGAEDSAHCWGAPQEPRSPVSNSGGGRTMVDAFALPTPIVGTAEAIDIAVGGLVYLNPEGILYGNLCVLERCGRVRCMGRNNLGQLGDGTTDNSLTFTEVLGLP